VMPQLMGESMHIGQRVVMPRMAKLMEAANKAVDTTK
jgi:hypothetical protein